MWFCFCVADYFGNIYWCFINAVEPQSKIVYCQPFQIHSLASPAGINKIFFSQMLPSSPEVIFNFFKECKENHEGVRLWYYMRLTNASSWNVSNNFSQNVLTALWWIQNISIASWGWSGGVDNDFSWASTFEVFFSYDLSFGISNFESITRQKIDAFQDIGYNR